jgi:endonuclease/exonuclease/phosphatase (EEP) superfamily protein YafD
LVLRAAYPVVERPLPGRWLALLVLAVADLGLILVFAGGLAALVDAVAPLTGHLFGIGMAASIALLVRRRIAVLLTVGVAATFGIHAWLGLGRCCDPGASTAPAPIIKAAVHEATSSLTVVALNAWRARFDLERFEQYLATAPADIVVLSEFDAAARPTLDRLRRVYPYQVQCSQEPPCSLALLSRSAFASSGSARIASDKPAFVWARLPGALTIVGTHLHHPALDPWLHQAQVSALAQFVRRIDGSLVLTGDLNTSPWSNGFRLLRNATDLSPASLLMPSWPAWPLALPQIALDHIFVSSDLGVTGTGTGPAVGSDHLPVWVRLERPAVPAGTGRAPRRRLASGPAAPGAHLDAELLADLGGEQGGAGNLSR